jgi:hypothetical protein
LSPTIRCLSAEATCCKVLDAVGGSLVAVTTKVQHRSANSALVNQQAVTCMPAAQHQHTALLPPHIHAIPAFHLTSLCCCVPHRPPDAISKHVGLTSRKCQPAEAAELLDETLRERYRQQVPGWRVQDNAAGNFIVCGGWGGGGHHTLLGLCGGCSDGYCQRGPCGVQAMQQVPGWRVQDNAASNKGGRGTVAAVDRVSRGQHASLTGTLGTIAMTALCPDASLTPRGLSIEPHTTYDAAKQLYCAHIVLLPP